MKLISINTYTTVDANSLIKYYLDEVYPQVRKFYIFQNKLRIYFSINSHWGFIIKSYKKIMLLFQVYTCVFKV